MPNKWGIDPNQNYERYSADWVHTGQQIINLLEIASAIRQWMILLDISATDREASKPDDEYGIPDKESADG